MVRGEVFRCPRQAGPAAASSSEPLRDRRPDRRLPRLEHGIVAPTSTSARPATFRPAIDLPGAETRVLVEQTTVVDPQRLGNSSGRLDAAEIQAVDDALRLILGL
jgi:mRNA interferase MazF